MPPVPFLRIEPPGNKVKESHSISHSLTSLNTRGDQTYPGEQGTETSPKFQALETTRAPFRGSLDAKACWGSPARSRPTPSPAHPSIGAHPHFCIPDRALKPEREAQPTPPPPPGCCLLLQSSMGTNDTSHLLHRL